jgi:hypothetical protein
VSLFRNPIPLALPQHETTAQSDTTYPTNEMHKHHSESENSNYLKKIFHRELLVDAITYSKSNKNKIKNSPIARGIKN